MHQVAKRVAVVTGASSGIGAELARALAGRGWHCVLLARREERLRPLAEEIGGEFELCDVSDRAAVDAVAARVLERHPRVHLLVNNAGYTERGDFLTGDLQGIENVVRTNYLGSVWCLRAFLPALRAWASAAFAGNGGIAPRCSTMLLAYPPPCDVNHFLPRGPDQEESPDPAITAYPVG